MKKQIGSGLAMLALVIAMTFTACKPKDADIEKNVAAAIAAYPGVTVTVKDGVATLSGEAADEAAKLLPKPRQSVKGVKSVNNILPSATAPTAGSDQSG
ncbi:MAG: BON domain-containing protein [Flavihumibacter sp.]